MLYIFNICKTFNFKQVDVDEEAKPTRGGLFAPRRRFRPRPFLSSRRNQAQQQQQDQQDKQETTTTTASPPRQTAPLTGRRRTFTSLLRRPRPTTQVHENKLLLF